MPSVICQPSGSPISVCFCIINEAKNLLPQLTLFLHVIFLWYPIWPGEMGHGTNIQFNRLQIPVWSFFLFHAPFVLLISPPSSQDTVSVHRPGFYADRFFKFMSSTVFKKSSCELILHPDTALHSHTVWYGERHKSQRSCFGLFYCRAFIGKSNWVAKSLIRCCLMSCEGKSWSHLFACSFHTYIFGKCASAFFKVQGFPNVLIPLDFNIIKY